MGTGTNQTQNTEIKKEWNKEEEYWFIRWIVMRRDLRKANEQITKLKGIIKDKDKKWKQHVRNNG